ncbi:ATP-binding protein [Mycoplasma feriruminatoris]|uniref:Primosomal protein n=1 Tax=Mycoplasma feriruminatoris TaxID=1179777 RepID=A0AAQ3HWR7_9MOLU|nr:ATP-binding protein [Mycoplasma feriruminatoris]UKS53936.1 istB-like ATP binding family protein [Mycoplasma feriruminatoris]WFQ90846.1 primosomal protein [Mycoplasma feriruminatoris]WFQ93364.1 primosomal protein [Mycoplasma feriruminatoris]WFQ94202.1 Primosomal protein DnaI [Mycoplasma feriruminatoris]WFQ95024.1 primosomal protein [Mycoplasma feriruminatoris]
MKLDDYKNNVKIKKLIDESLNSNDIITDQVLLDNQNILDEFLLNYKECSLDKECNQVVKNYQVDLVFKDHQFYLKNVLCIHGKQTEKLFIIKKNYWFSDFDINSFHLTYDEYFNNQLNNLSFNLLDQNEKNFRKTLLSNILKAIQKGYKKGIYLYGNSGIGKTYMFKVLANTLASKNKTVIFSTLRSLIDKLKESFNSNEINSSELLKKIKNVDFLFLDDIGGENLSLWARDDFLFEVLNYRLENKKPTFFTSNFSIDLLEKNLQFTRQYNNFLTSKDVFELEKIKIDRLISRIKALVKEINFTGINKRRTN